VSELGDPADVQGTLLRGYRVEYARHLVLRIDDPVGARDFLGSLVSGSSEVPQITTAEAWGKPKPESFLNVGITCAGLRRLGVEDRFLATFPSAFRRGATDTLTKQRVGDTGPSDSSHWIGHLGEGDAVHLILTLWITRFKTERRRVTNTLRHAFGPAGQVLSVLDAASLPGNKVHFGYTDNISQPVIETAPAPKRRRATEGAGWVPITHVLLHSRRVQPEDLSTNSSFAAFRVLKQDVAAFERFLDERSAETGLDRELLAAKICGRWRNGVPLVRSPDTCEPAPPLTDEELNDFDYLDDPLGYRCPIGSHIRRTHPRSQPVTGGPGHTVRIVRRGMPYGRQFSPEQPDRRRRGLMGYFISADPFNFEFVMSEWVNKSDFVRSNPADGSNARYNISGQDVLIGVNDRKDSSFTLPVGPEGARPPVNRVLNEFGPFVTTKGGAYVYLPSITALRYLASLRP